MYIKYCVEHSLAVLPGPWTMTYNDVSKLAQLHCTLPLMLSSLVESFAASRLATRSSRAPTSPEKRIFVSLNTIQLYAS